LYVQVYAAQRMHAAEVFMHILHMNNRFGHCNF
jgi:hypothetical protein